MALGMNCFYTIFLMGTDAAVAVFPHVAVKTVNLKRIRPSVTLCPTIQGNHCTNPIPKQLSTMRGSIIVHVIQRKETIIGQTAASTLPTIGRECFFASSLV
jgi:hypothetical protein